MKGRAIGAIFVVGALCTTYFLIDGVLFVPFILVCLVIGLIELQAILETYSLNSDYKYRISVPLECGVFLFAIPCVLFACGRTFTALVIIACCVSDTSAFVFGSLFGKSNRVKFLSNISAKKSWAGFIAGAILPIPAVIFIAKTMGLLETNDKFAIIVYAIIAGIVAEFGDLIESAAKRTLQVKDSGEALAKIPFFGLVELPLIGHGGYLDRFDSAALSLLVFSAIRVFLTPS